MERSGIKKHPKTTLFGTPKKYHNHCLNQALLNFFIEGKGLLFNENTISNQNNAIILRVFRVFQVRYFMACWVKWLPFKSSHTYNLHENEKSTQKLYINHNYTSSGQAYHFPTIDQNK